MKQTSIEAYLEKITNGTIENDYARIYRTLKQLGKPLTYCEIALWLGWGNPNKASRRMAEMVRVGLIEENDPRICSIAGTRCTTYVIKNEQMD
jgi:hypothetical protein